MIPATVNGYTIRGALPAPRFGDDAFVLIVARTHDYATAIWRPQMGPDEWWQGNYGFMLLSEAVQDALERTGLFREQVA